MVTATSSEYMAALRLVEMRHQLRAGPRRRDWRDRYADDPLLWLAERAWVRRQDALVRFQMQQWHEEVYRELTGADAVLKSRDVGSSTFFVALRLHDVLFHPPGDVLVAADRGDNAKNLIDYAHTILVNLPDGERSRITKDNTQELEFEVRSSDSGRILKSGIQAITATPSAGRSYRCRHLICTEMGFWKQDRRYWTSVTGAVAPGATTVCESTWPEAGAFTLYAQLWSDPARGFKRHFIGRRDVDWHDAAWEAERRMRLTAADFARECPTTPEEAMDAPAEDVFRVFTREALRRAHDVDGDETLAALNSFTVALGHPQPGRRYSTGWDLGRSKGRGAAVGITIDITTPVHFIRMIQRYEQNPWPLTQEYIKETYNAFPGETLVEVNGVGDPVIGNLTVPVTPFLTAPRTKTYMIKHTVTQMEQGFLKWEQENEDYPIGQLDVELQLYDWRDQGLVQDCVIALCIAEYGASLGGVGFMR